MLGAAHICLHELNIGGSCLEEVRIKGREFYLEKWKVVCFMDNRDVIFRECPWNGDLWVSEVLPLRTYWWRLCGNFWDVAGPPAWRETVNDQVKAKYNFSFFLLPSSFLLLPPCGRRSIPRGFSDGQTLWLWARSAHSIPVDSPTKPVSCLTVRQRSVRLQLWLWCACQYNPPVITPP